MDVIERVARAMNDDKSRRHYGLAGDWDGLTDYHRKEWLARARAAIEALKPSDVVTEDEAERVARLFHDTYERLAPQFGYETREASAKPWEEVPDNNRNLMIATVREVLAMNQAAQSAGEERCSMKSSKEK